MTQLNADNFTEQTGKRFRVNNVQKARIEITKLDATGRDAVRQNKTDMTALAEIFSLKQSARWLERVGEVIDAWDDATSPLTRDQAFEEFMQDGGLDRLMNQKPDVPNSVFLDEDLTLDNFEDKVEAAIGVKRRFRVSRGQHARIAAGELTREEAFQETVARIRAEQQTEVTNEQS
jgi:hypothetical protein